MWKTRIQQEQPRNRFTFTICFDIVLNQNGVFYPAWYKTDWKQQNLKIASIYHSADYVFWQSNFCKIASDKFLGKRLGQGEVLYNAVDTQKFIPKLRKSNKD